jgi:hypothetical protein
MEKSLMGYLYWKLPCPKAVFDLKIKCEVEKREGRRKGRALGPRREAGQESALYTMTQE